MGEMILKGNQVRIRPNDDKLSSSLIKNRAFVFLWLSSSTSFLALSTYLFAEQWYIVTKLKNEPALGIVMMVTMVPRVLLMVIGGVWSDRAKRSLIMLVSSMIRCLLVVSIVFFLQLNLLELWALIIFALLFGIVDAFFSPANTSLLPSLVSKDELIKSNSFIQSSNQIAMFSGPMIGGVLFSIGSFSLLFSFVAFILFLTFLFSFLIKEGNSTTIATTKKNSIKKELIEGMTYVWKMPFLKNLLIILIFINFFFFGPLLMGIPLIVESVIQGNTLDLSFLQSSYQGGMLLGAIFVGLINVRKKNFLTSLILIFSLGLCLSQLGQIKYLWQGIFLLVTMGICSSIINVTVISTIQEKSHSDKIGRVMSLVNASSNGLVPLSYGFVSLALVMNLTISDIMLLSGCIIMVISLLYLLIPKLKNHNN